MAVGDVVDAMMQAMDAIAEAHALGIVHRDLKPSNLFMTERRDGMPLVKVLDFGISKTTRQDESSLTTGDTLLGSPRYMSPEQMRSTRDVDNRTDIWSLGVIIHELLTGRPPFHAPNTAGLCAAIMTEAPPPLRTVAPRVPEALERIVLRCLEKDPARRFASIADLAAALAPFASHPAAAAYAERIARMSARIRTSAPPAAPTGTLPLATRVNIELVDPRAATQATPTELAPYRDPNVRDSNMPARPYIPSAPPRAQHASGGLKRRWMFAVAAMGVVAGGAAVSLLFATEPIEPEPVITTSTRMAPRTLIPRTIESSAIATPASVMVAAPTTAAPSPSNTASNALPRTRPSATTASPATTVRPLPAPADTSGLSERK